MGEAATKLLEVRNRRGWGLAHQDGQASYQVAQHFAPPAVMKELHDRYAKWSLATELQLMCDPSTTDGHSIPARQVGRGCWPGFKWEPALPKATGCMGGPQAVLLGCPPAQAQRGEVPFGVAW